MKILITGVTGTLGREVLSQLLSKTRHKIIGYSRDEQKQRTIPAHKRLTLYLGDVRDRARLVESSRDVDLIFHFAALKCVDTLEENPEEAIATNVIGTENVLFAQRRNKIPRVVLSSTDKAAYPINAYGNTKALAEKLVLRNKNNVVCRYGNVLASRGSVIPTFVKVIKQDGIVPITDHDMTRFFIRIEDAAAFVIKSGFEKNGGLKIPQMKASLMTNVALAIGDLLGKSNVTFGEVGIRPGEKINECLRMAHEGDEVHSHTAEQFEHSELIDLLTPVVEGLT